MVFARWRARRVSKILIDQIHGEIVAAARARVLYAALAVPDDVDGRFEMAVLHAGLVLRRLGRLGPETADLSQDLVDRLFEGFDDALREMSISDAGVARRIKNMAEAFYGRVKVYDDAIEARDAPALAAAIARNALRAGNAPAPTVGALAERVFAIVDHLEQVPFAAFLEGQFRYPEPEVAK